MMRTMLAAGLGLALTGGAALAETGRCQAEYVLLTLPKKLSREERPGSFLMARFSAEGECRIADRCRERARNSILICASAHRYAPNETPAACTPRAHVRDYPVGNLGDLWEKAILRACCSAPLGAANTVFSEARLVVRSIGDAGCGQSKWRDASGARKTMTEAVAWGPAPDFSCALVADRCAAGGW